MTTPATNTRRGKGQQQVGGGSASEGEKFPPIILAIETLEQANTISPIRDMDPAKLFLLEQTIR